MLLPGAVASGLMVPFIGKALQAGVKQTRMIPGSFFLFFVFTLWVSFQISPAAGEDDFFWPLTLYGLAMGLIFLPITTMSLSGLQSKDAAQASGLTLMLRQLGGSFGVGWARSSSALIPTTAPIWPPISRSSTPKPPSAYDVRGQLRPERFFRRAGATAGSSGA